MVRNSAQERIAQLSIDVQSATLSAACRCI
jgi:hypothetical protein